MTTGIQYVNMASVVSFASRLLLNLISTYFTNDRMLACFKQYHRLNFAANDALILSKYSFYRLYTESSVGCNCKHLWTDKSCSNEIPKNACSDMDKTVCCTTNELASYP